MSSWNGRICGHTILATEEKGIECIERWSKSQVFTWKVIRELDDVHHKGAVNEQPHSM